MVAISITVGCGGGGSDSTSEVAAGQASTQASAEVEAHNEAVRREYEERRAAEAPTSEEADAEQAAADFYEVLGEDKAKDNPDRTTIDSASFCDLMSEKAIAQTIHYARASSGIAKQWDCESAVELLVIRSKRSGDFEGFPKAEVIGVNAQDGKATATVRLGDGPATSIPLVEEDGEWKLAASVPTGP